jgi:hypothetical protein
LSGASAIRRDLRRNWPLYAMALPGILAVLVFGYGPLFGLANVVADGISPEQAVDEAIARTAKVDPQINACMLTSRIRLALSSVQLFIQRLLLGMESASIPEGLAEDLSWLRTYRVWEANRKVFFWPENWAERSDSPSLNAPSGTASRTT